MLGQSLGADDYIPNPFNSVKPITGVCSRQRRDNPWVDRAAKALFVCGGFELDNKTKRVPVAEDCMGWDPYDVLYLMLAALTNLLFCATI